MADFVRDLRHAVMICVCLPGTAWVVEFVFFFSSRRRHTRCSRDWSSDVCSSDLSHLLNCIQLTPMGSIKTYLIIFLFSCLLETISISAQNRVQKLYSRSLMDGKKEIDRKSTRLNSSHGYISYAVFCLKKKKKK